MRFVWTIIFLGGFFAVTRAQQLQVYDLSCDSRINPVGIDNPGPRLSWKLKADGTNIVQQAYSIRVASAADFKKAHLVWESGKTGSDQSAYVPYRGPALKSGTRYYWQVKVWDNRKRESPWSGTGFWEMGILSPSGWKATWIEPVQDTARSLGTDIPALMVRKDFNISRKVLSARAYVTSHGFYELSINGRRVGDELLTPGWTSYNKRLQYQVYDITPFLQQGSNAVGAVLGDGWYRGRLGWAENFGVWGKTLGLLCQLNILYADGSEETIGSDKSWQGTDDGPIVMNSIYDGETYDARKEVDGWNRPGFDATAWPGVQEAEYNKSILVATETVPVKIIEEIKPKRIFRTPRGTLVVDMGQNMVGWIRLNVKAPAGTTVTIRHAEVLDKDGEFYTENLRSAAATATYITKGSAAGEVYEPRFTFFGFRYLSVDGFPGDLQPANITGIVIHSKMQVTGTFECSNPLVNQLQHNILWGQKGNFVDVPTDCPQRDERLGWTGDAQAFCRTAAFNMDVSAFFRKWLRDVSADQLPDGKIPFVIPDALKVNATSAGWGDVATIAPWTMYQVYGDKSILEDQYASMKAYVDYIQKRAGDRCIWKGGSVFGDWLYFKPQMEEHTVPDGHTDRDMIATMFYAYSSRILAQVAGELGRNDDARYYQDLFQKIREIFNAEYVSASGRIISDSQTSYVLALMFDLLPGDLRTRATEYLVADIRQRGNHLSTGFLGTPYLCHVLSSHGQTKVAFDLLLQESFPSWLFPVKMGATTIWERWDGEKPDSTFQDKNMNSFNHYAYGAIGDWLYRVVAGIEMLKPGYKQMLIQPHPDNRLSYAKAGFESVYGEIVSGWERKDGTLRVQVTIPANSSAVVRLPGTTAAQVSYKGGSLDAPGTGFTNVRDENGDAVFEAGSGRYEFSYRYGGM